MAILCNLSVDYSNDSSNDRILPFKFTLTDDSVLSPEEGEFQKFCYDVEATGTDNSDFADLSHFILGICPNLTQADFHSVTVTINGVPQTVIWGGNVEIKTPEKPDHPTQCSGLKINFPLDKETGNVMHVCFELNSVSPVGPTNVCLFGGNTTKTGMSICGPACSSSQGCTQTVFQQETVCVPVTVRPFAIAGEATTVCCGEPVVTSGTSPCTGGSECTFTVRQTICVEVPITFGADVRTGAATTSCGTASSGECDCISETPEASFTDTASENGCSCRYDF